VCRSLCSPRLACRSGPGCESVEGDTSRALHALLRLDPLQKHVRVTPPGDWRSGFEYARQASDAEPDEGPGLTWRQLITPRHWSGTWGSKIRNSSPRHWSGTWGSKIRGTVTAEADGWVAYVRLEDPPGLSPITTVGRFDTVDEAQAATDEVWASRWLPPRVGGCRTGMRVLFWRRANRSIGDEIRTDG
jgi:hypothetical protein